MPRRDHRLRLLAPHDAPAVHEARSAAIMLAHVGFGYSRGHRALDDVSLRIPEGTTCAVLGPNGAGKSTLLELVAGLRTPTTGSLTVLGEASVGLPDASRHSVALVTPRLSLPSGLRIASLLRYVAPWHARWKPQVADALLSHFRLAGRQRLDTLSLGGRMKVQLLCALAACPRLLLLDEPFTGLDLGTKDALVHALLLPDDADGRTVLVATHDLAELELLVDHLILLQDGRVRLEGSLDDLRTNVPRATSLRELYRTHTATRLEDPAA